MLLRNGIKWAFEKDKWLEKVLYKNDHAKIKSYKLLFILNKTSLKIYKENKKICISKKKYYKILTKSNERSIIIGLPKKQSGRGRKPLPVPEVVDKTSAQWTRQILKAK